MQIKSVIIDNIHYINFITFNISTLFHKNFFLIYPAEISIIYPWFLNTVKYGNSFLMFDRRQIFLNKICDFSEELQLLNKKRIYYRNLIKNVLCRICPFPLSATPEFVTVKRGKSNPYLNSSKFCLSQVLAPFFKAHKTLDLYGYSAGAVEYIDCIFAEG